MTSDSDAGSTRRAADEGGEGAEARARVVVAVRDEEARQRLREVLRSANVDLEVVEPDADPLRDPTDHDADLLVVHRSDVRPEDLRLVDAYTDTDSNPGLVVLHDAGEAGSGDADRARLRAAGASSVLDAGESDRALRDTIAAMADAAGEGAPAAPDPQGGDLEARLADFRSRSPRMRRFLELVERVIETDSSLLITGETGVGKERLAQAIHNEGARAAGPFVSVNCGAIPEALLESELFGHEAGAFTGANRRRRGRFELADGGTIFLDEIAEMPAHLQVNLLTVLQRLSVRRVGGETTIPIDVRVMAATNRNVLEEVRSGRFREDLYYRLNVVSIEIPPLRERIEDIADLVGGFIGRFRHALGRRNVAGITDDALDALVRWRWPGNVRELVNAIEHAIVLCRTDHIGLADLPDTVTGQHGEIASDGRSAAPRHDGGFDEELLSLPFGEARRRVTRRFEYAYLYRLLVRTGGRVQDTAELAGITPRALYDHMKRHGLRKEDFR